MIRRRSRLLVHDECSITRPLLSRFTRQGKPVFGSSWEPTFHVPKQLIFGRIDPKGSEIVSSNTIFLDRSITNIQYN